jgi:oligosaccharide repeat unit polymerase
MSRSTKSSQEGRRSVAINVLFAPYVIAVGLQAPLLVAYLAMPTDVFENHFFGRKWDGLLPSVYYSLAVALFAIGAVLGDLMVRRPGEASELEPSRRQRTRLERICIVALVASILGYSIWFARGVVNAGGLHPLIDAFRTDPGLVRDTFFTTLPGVTTLSEAALAGVPLAIAFGLMRRRSIAVLVVLTLLIAFSWAVIASQRFAFLELAIPISYLLVARRRTTLPRLVGIAALLLVTVVAFFVIAEVRRRSPYETFTIDDALWRFASYYLSTMNNSFAMADHYQLATPLFFSTQAVWEFPAIHHVGVTYEAFSGIDAPSLVANFYRDNSVTPSITTLGLPGEVAADFGWAGLLWILGLGAAAGAMYRAGTWNPLYRALYAVWLVGVFEFVRIYFFFLTRVVPAYLVFTAVFFALGLHRRRAPAEVDAGAPPAGVASG